MTRKRVTASEKKQRHEWAVRQIDAGMGLSELTAFTAETWGCSCRNARDVVAAAHKDWLDACYGSEEIEQRDLLFQQVGRLERIARKAENSGQFSAAVGAITALNRMMALGADQRVSEVIAPTGTTTGAKKGPAQLSLPVVRRLFWSLPLRHLERHCIHRLRDGVNGSSVA